MDFRYRYDVWESVLVQCRAPNERVVEITSPLGIEQDAVWTKSDPDFEQDELEKAIATYGRKPMLVGKDWVCSAEGRSKVEKLCEARGDGVPIAAWKFLQGKYRQSIISHGVRRREV